MAEQQITNLGTSAAPLERRIKNSERFELLAVKATFNGGAAASAWVPVVEVISDSGRIVGTFPADDQVAAGSTVDATFAPFLRNKRGDIRFGVVNVGNWLDIETTEEGPKFVGFSLIVGEGIDDREGDSDFTFGRDWNISGGNDYNLVFDNDINLQSVNDTNIVGRHDVNLVALNNGAFVVGTSGAAGKFLELRAAQGAGFGAQITLTDVMQLFPQTTLRILLNTGQKVEVQDHNANPIFRINEDGSLQGKTGKALTFNL